MVKNQGMAQLRKKAKRGFRGYPVATIAFYGPDDSRASKVAVGIIADESHEVGDLERWYSHESDVRVDIEIGEEIRDFIRLHGVRSVVIANGIIGCPHEEGKDYPVGQHCPECPFWAGRDRFTHEIIQ